MKSVQLKFKEVKKKMIDYSMFDLDMRVYHRVL